MESRTASTVPPLEASRPPHLLRTRTPTPGPELDLVTPALRSYMARSLAAPPLILREPEFPTGFPDVVAVFCRDHPVPPTPARLSLGLDHLKLLHHLHTVQHGSTLEIAATLGWTSERRLRSMLDDLERALLVRQHRDRAIAKPLQSVFIAKRIVAVEAKIRDWQGALRQAAANTWFASHSYILMPAPRLSRTICQHANRLGIGVMAYDGERVVTRLRARRWRIPASYGSWLVNEWAVRRVNRLY